MTGRTWVDAVLAAGATAASFVPDAGGGRSEPGDPTNTALIEDPELRVHPVARPSWHPPAAAFLNGIQEWRVVAYDGIVPVLHAWVAAAVRRRDPDRRLHTVHELGRAIAITFRDRLSSAVRTALERSGVTIRDAPADRFGPPPAAIAAARVVLEGERVRVEREAGAWWAAHAPAAEWLVVDGVLSEHAALAGHPRALGIVKSPGARYFDGQELERALTIPAGHRTGVFQPGARGSGAVYSWYLRLWPWEGHDLQYGLIRVEAPVRRESVTQVDAVSAWILAERAPVVGPDARWDRLLYPLHDVETYLRTRAPAAPGPRPASRLPARPA